LAEQKIGHGGHNKETILLTIKTFKLFCLKAGTAKANQIHEYYIKLEETIHEIVNEESNELKLQLEDVKNTLVKSEEQNKKTIENLIKEKALEKHNLILREFATAGCLIYIIKVKSYENGEYVIKIGESRRGIHARYNEHKSNYEEAIILDCFLVKQSKDFESYIHNHHDIRCNQVIDLPGHENEKELFLIGKNLSYRTLLNLIKTSINRFNDFDYEQIKSDIETIKNIVSNEFRPTPIEDKFITFEKMVENQELLLQRITRLENTNKEILEKLNENKTRITTGFEQPLPTIGPRLQKINPENMQLVKVYESVSECMKEDANIKRPSINKAIQENTIYNGFRWAFVERTIDPNILQNIQPTKITKSQNLGYIAKLNSEKTQILNVYLDRKTASTQNNYQSISALDNPVRSGTITNGHYYMLYDKCEDDLKNEFIIRNKGEPFLYKDGVGQFDSSNKLIREFNCKYDCIRKLNMSDKTLAKALDKNVTYNGFTYRTLTAKLSCF
jgi:hypothetical protein